MAKRSKASKHSKPYRHRSVGNAEGPRVLKTSGHPPVKRGAGAGAGSGGAGGGRAATGDFNDDFNDDFGVYP